jgi:hypothetical protein
VEGSIHHPNAGEAWEYAVVVTITNDRGEELTRQVVGVGALQPGEERTFTFGVEVFTPSGLAEQGAGEPVAAATGASPIISAHRLR